MANQRNQLGRTLVIANPDAGKGRGGDGAAFVERFLETDQAITKGFQLTYTSVDHTARSIAADAAGFDTVVALGGDGVIHDVVNGLMTIKESQRPRLGVLPMGSGNDFARTIHGALNDVVASLGQLVNGTPIPMDLGQINGTYFIQTCSFGIDAAIALESSKRRAEKVRGKSSSFATIGLDLFRTHRHGWKFKAVLDGKTTITGEELVFACQVGPTYGGGFQICPEASPVDGLLDLAYNVTVPSIPKTLATFIAAKGGHHTKMGIVDFARFSELKVTFEEEPPAQVDGEPIHGKKFTVRTVPGALEVLVPNSCKWNPDRVVVGGPSLVDGLVGTKIGAVVRGEDEKDH